MPKEKPEPKKEDTTVIDKLNKDISDDQLDDDDFFEKLLNKKVDLPTDDDPENKDKDAKIDDLTKEDNEPTIEELKGKIATLEKEAKGRLSDTVKSRQEKAQFKTELTQLKTAVSSLLDKKQEIEKDPLPLEDPKRKVEFEEDESAFVDLSPVKTAIQTESEKTQKQIDQLKQADVIRTAKEQYDKTLNNILDVDREKYDPAYSKLQEIMKVLNSKVIDAQNRTGTWDNKDGGIDIDVGLDLIDGSPEEQEFLKDFPGVNPINIARAFNSKRDLRFALDHVSETLLKVDPDDESKKLLEEKDAELLKKAKTKPGSLTNQENQSGADSSLLDRIGKLSTQQIMDISDAEADKIEKLMLDEELRGE